MSTHTEVELKNEGNLFYSGIVKHQNRRAEDTDSLHVHTQWSHSQPHSGTARTEGNGCQCHKMAAMLGLFALESWWQPCSMCLKYIS